MASLLLDGVAPAPGAISGDQEGDREDTWGGDSDHGRRTRFIIRFPKAPFAARPSGEYMLTLTGSRMDGAPIWGTGPLTVRTRSYLSAKPAPKPHGLRVVQTAGARSAIAFSLAQPSEVMVEVLDLQGRLVARLERGTLPAGDYQRDWPAVGQSVPSGIYMVRLRTVESQEVTRLAVMR